jgi:NAD-dependent dihydropyrimidine dehydrogenase PreA subunit
VYVSKIDPIYIKLAGKVNLPKSKTIPRIFQKIANLQQARIMDELPNQVENIAKKLELTKAKVQRDLQYLYERGLVTPGRTGWSLKRGVVTPGKTGWNMVLSWGALKDSIGSAHPKYDDDELLDLTREMSLEILKGQLARGEKPPVRKVMRVIPKWRTIKDVPGVLPCEDAREIFKNASTIVVHRCPCRAVYRNRPNKDKVPEMVCLGTGQRYLARRQEAKVLTYDETIALLDKIDNLPVPIVNMGGTTKRISQALCSCGDDCGLFVRNAITKPLNGEYTFMKSRFIVPNNMKTCSGCGICVKRCPVNAIKMKESKSGKKFSYTNIKECIGCGLCVLTCKTGARKMKLVRPPEDIPDTMSLEAEAFVP